MKSNRFYLACFRDNVGTSVSFHCKNGRGYSTDISKAHEYTREDAQRKWENAREFEIPLCSDRVDALSVFKVDCQYIPRNNHEIESDGSGFVGYQKDRWNGNDVYWLSDRSLPTDDFSMASVTHNPCYANESLICWVPFSYAENAKRPTISNTLINKKKMVQAAGLITPDWVKKMNRRSDTGLVRWNCPKCGKISWQHNPYDFDGCSDVSCDEWRSPYL